MTKCAFDELKLRLALRDLLDALPFSVECNDFDHSRMNMHEGFDCPCVQRYANAISAAKKALHLKEAV